MRIVGETKINDVDVLFHPEKFPGMFTNDDYFSDLRMGNFIDLRAAETIVMKAGDFKLIPLGISVKLPDRYWAQVVPRSSTFKKYGIIMTNSFGVIDNTYCGNDDIWMFPAYALRDTTIPVNDRICQFRIVEDNEIEIHYVRELNGPNRGGFGSTGTV